MSATAHHPGTLAAIWSVPPRSVSELIESEGRGFRPKHRAFGQAFRPSTGCAVLSSPDPNRIDPNKIASIYADVGHELRCYIAAILKDRELADEVLQVVLKKTLEVGHTVHSNLRGWMFRVALQECQLHKRESQRERTILQKAFWKSGGRAVSNEQPATSTVRDEVVAAVRQAIESLPVEQQTIVRLRIYEEKKFADIAEELQIPLGTALTRMRAAMQKLEAALQQHAE